jgi:hypothetical protein
MTGHFELGLERMDLKLKAEISEACQALGTIEAQLSHSDQLRIAGI